MKKQIESQHEEKGLQMEVLSAKSLKPKVSMAKLSASQRSCRFKYINKGLEDSIMYDKGLV